MSSKEKISKAEQEYWRPAVEAIRQDSVHGSLYLSNQALDLVEDFIQRRLYRNRTELIQALSKLSNALVRAKPLMALIYNRTRRVLKFIQTIPKEEKDIEHIRTLALQEVDRIREETAEQLQTVARLGARLILDGHVVLTHSASSMVESVFKFARQNRKKFKVICTESRPLGEGRELAVRLANMGIKTTLIPDADIARAMEAAHFAYLGTDRFTENTFVNKTGTHAISVMARNVNKPVYVVGLSEKILLKRTYPCRYLPAPPTELIPESVPNLSVQNLYFEETPIELVDKVIIDTGVFELKEFCDRYL